VPDPISFGNALRTAEAEVDNLAAQLDVPLEGRTTACIVVLGIARQAHVVYQGVRREALADPTGINPAILLRPLIEAAIVVRWIEDSPELRVDMYLAEDKRQKLAALDSFKAFRKRRGGTSSGPLLSRAEVRNLTAHVSEVRTRARAAAEPIGTKGPVVPAVEEMATSTRDTATWEAYQIVYRVASPYTHVGAWSLASHSVEVRAGGSHLVVAGGLSGLAARAMATPAMAHLIGSASRICRLGLEGEARIWQDAVIEWPAPIVDEVNP
jgi:hypothetical protein